VFNSILSVVSETQALEISSFIECTIASLILGVIIGFIYMYKNNYSKSFVITLALMPAIVQVIIMMVNGNIGTSVAVMGAFSLVRFRSIPGSAREIGSIFMAMAVGLVTGMGYIGVAVIFLLIIGATIILLFTVRFGEKTTNERELKIIIPENLDYADVFTDLFEKYTKKASLIRVKTTNMGSLYELYYQIELINNSKEKAMIDEIRCRNGNLNIMCGKAQYSTDIL